MQSNQIISYNSISPEKVFRGSQAWEHGKESIPLISQRPLLLGRSKATSQIRAKLFKELHSLGLKPTQAELKNDCCEQDLKNISKISLRNNCDSIIAAGGGKVLDAGKLVADRLNIPSITIPLSAATCAGWTALSNIYSPNGAFIKDQSLKSCPKILIFDHSLVRNAPPRTLASGIADGIAKWYEASLVSSCSNDGFIQQAVQMARVLRDQLFIDGVEAFQDSSSDSWIRVSEACALTAGLIGGIGGVNCRTAAAHPIHNGFTQLKFSKAALHGEIVGFGLIIQLQLEELYSSNKLAKQAKKQLINFLNELNLPISIDTLGLTDTSATNIKKACNFTCNYQSEFNSLPFYISEDMLYDSIKNTKIYHNEKRYSNIKN